MKSILASILLVTACSSDPLEPGAGNDPGTGTKTLFVDGVASAEPRVDNAKLAADFTTEFSVAISLGNLPVVSGTVTVKSRFGEAPLTWEPSAGSAGRWTGSMASYDEVYQLDVVSDADEVRGVIVDGPDIHVFSDALVGATLDSTVANSVTWSREDAAEITSFKTDEIDRITIADTGTYMMGAGSMHADKSAPRENTLEVRRTNHVAPSGAVGGSDFAVTVTNSVQVLAAPNPAL